MVKSKKKSLSNAVNERKSKKDVNPFATAKSMDSKHCNPFEVHVNKEKFKILGRKCKHDKGLPGVSRLKAAQKRKLTLAQEYITVHKSNKFRDRRIGKHLTGDKLNEDIIQARYAADRILKMKTNKHTKFNLDDGDILTHAGQSLDMIEQFPNASSEEDEDLDAEFTEKIQFNESSANGDRINGKTAIDELIAKQKQRKLEIAKEKDIVHELTDKLDTNYKNLLDSIHTLTKNDDITKPKMDAYDLALREMIFEPRSAVTNRLKTEAELNEEKANHLKVMEEECLKRMAGNDEDNNTNYIKHRSADDLDEGYFQKDNDNEAEDGLVYNSSGKLNSNDADDDVSQNQIDNKKETTDDEENDDETEEEEESDNESENESETENTSGSEDDGIDLSDLKDIVSDDKQSLNILNNIYKMDGKSILQSKKSLKERILLGGQHLPLIKDIPVDYEDFVKLLSTHKVSDQVNIVENLISLCQQEKTVSNTEDVMIQLFAFLLQLIDERFAKSTVNNLQENFQFLSLITPVLYDFMHFHPFHMSNLLRNIIVEKYTDYKCNIKQYPNLTVLIVFKLISNLCSTSDFVHPLSTPCYIFMNSILSNAELYNFQDISKSLFIITLSLEYARLSKRFLPSVFNSIYNLLSLTINDKTKLANIPYSPIIKTGPSSKLLVLNVEKAPLPASKMVDLDDYRLSCKDLLNDTNSTCLNFKLRAFNQCLHLLDEAVTMIADHTGAKLLIAPILKLFNFIPIKKYPPGVKENFNKVKASLEALSGRKLIKLVAPKKKPKALRLLEPRIETVYDDKRRPNLPPARKEKVKLLHKIKREKKSAMREIRRDTEFLQKMRLKQQLQSDMERRQKVKRIYQEASMQQGELNALERLKKKKSF